MSDEGPIVANLRLDGILPHDVANEESHQLTQSLLRSINVETNVLVDSNTACKHGVAFITYSNDSNYPLFLNAQLLHSHHLIAKPHTLSTEIPPNSSKTIEIAFDAIQPFDLKEHIQLEMMGSIGYQLEEFPDLALEGSVIIPITDKADKLLPTEEVEFVGSYLVDLPASPRGTALHYTLDGSEPTMNSLRYTRPFKVSKEMAIKARLFTEDGTMKSAIDQEEVRPIEPGQGLWAALYTYEQVGRSWGGINDFQRLHPISIKATQELDPVKIAGRPAQFGLLLSGQIVLPERGEYLFKVLSDDGVRVLIDGQEVVADPIKHKAREASGKAYLEAGLHEIEIQYFQWKRKYALEVSMVLPSGKEQQLTAEDMSYGNYSTTKNPSNE